MVLNGSRASLTALRVGVVGCGVISGAYFAATRQFPVLNITACADLDRSAAERAASQWGVAALSVGELLARDDLDLILNLTVPRAHASVTLAALAAGKHVYLEKPLALDRAEGKRVLAAAEAAALRVGCAPDTFLGAGLQTCQRLVESGALGRIVAGTAFMMGPGHESWHPNPDFYYRRGGGPVFDMGPYYLTALVQLLGPVRRVSAMSAVTFETRTIGSEPRRGERIRVEVPTHVSGTLEFVGGAVVTLVMSFDVQAHTNHPIELHGERGSLQVPDPNGFGGPVRVRLAGADTWAERPLVNGYTDNVRGVGAADLAQAVLTGRPERAHSSLAYHVLDVMQALHEAAETGQCQDVESRCRRPEPLSLGVGGGVLGARLEASA